MVSQQEPGEDPARPEGLETRPPSQAIPGDADRPEWLVGADSVLENAEDDASPARPSIADVKAGPLRVVRGGKPEPPKGWAGAASSIPKLSVVPSHRPPEPMIGEEEGPGLGAPGMDGGLPSSDSTEADPDQPASAAPAFRPLDEPWYLVWSEAMLTPRNLKIAFAIVLLSVAAWFFWPRHGERGASLGSIVRHPERFQGQVVAVSGEVLESFEVGTGHAFQLRQGRDVVVVYSTLREPHMHEHVEVRGIVSTGYLDGAPRVAIFEGQAP
jgi:hypothetical protein